VSAGLGYSKVYLRFRDDKTQRTVGRYIVSRRGHPLCNVATVFVTNWYRIEGLARMLGLMSSSPHESGTGIVIDIAGIDRLSDPQSLGGHAVEMMGCAIVIGAWTAFEALAADLWIAAVNARPNNLGKAAARSKKRISIHEIARHEFEIKNHMGEILRRRYRWGSLEKIQRAYATAFVQNKRILRPFRTPYLHVLNQCRNLLVHKGGIIDQKFHDNVSGIPELKDEPVGSVLHFDGELICKLAKAARKASFSLLFATDRWLARYPDSISLAALDAAARNQRSSSHPR